MPPTPNYQPYGLNTPIPNLDLVKYGIGKSLIKGSVSPLVSSRSDFGVSVSTGINDIDADLKSGKLLIVIDKPSRDYIFVDKKSGTKHTLSLFEQLDKPSIFTPVQRFDVTTVDNVAFFVFISQIGYWSNSNSFTRPKQI